MSLAFGSQSIFKVSPSFTPEAFRTSVGIATLIELPDLIALTSISTIVVYQWLAAGYKASWFTHSIDSSLVF